VLSVHPKISQWKFLAQAWGSGSGLLGLPSEQHRNGTSEPTTAVASGGREVNSRMETFQEILRMCRYQRIAIFLLVMLCASCSSTNHRRESCALERPPPNAGEGAIHALFFRVFPRNAELGSKFSGCQSVWAGEGPELILWYRTFYEMGEPYRYEAYAPIKVVCEYAAQRLLTQNSECMSFKEARTGTRSTTAECREVRLREGIYSSRCMDEYQ
jgi:hypothetical protein